MLLSAAMIVKDEEARLGACLESLGPFVDEIVVNVAGSTDDSINIAKAAGAKVIEGSWSNDFSAARNAAAAVCSGRWILRIDADERVSGSPQAVRDRLENSTDETSWKFPICIPGLPTPLYGAHLYRKDAFTWQGAVHEFLWPISGRLNSPPELIPGLVISSVRSSNGVVSTERNLAVALRAVERGDTVPFAGYPELMAAYSLLNLGRADEADEWLSRAKRRIPEQRTPLVDAFLQLVLAVLRDCGWAGRHESE